MAASHGLDKGSRGLDKHSNGHAELPMLAPFTSGQQVVDAHPLVIEKAEGIYVHDNQGRKFLDALAGLWCLALGGSEERLVEAATQQMKTLPFYHSFWNRTNKPALLISMFKAALERTEKHVTELQKGG